MVPFQPRTPCHPVAIALSFALLLAILAGSTPAAAQAVAPRVPPPPGGAAAPGGAPAGAVAQVVISQIYGGGGSAAGVLRNDFVELLNRGTTAVDLMGWSVQYAASAGVNWQRTPLSGVIAPGQYYLIQEGPGTTGAPLPRPDVSGTILMSATTGKIALVNNGTVIAAGTACPSGPSIVDFIGYGAANCFQGAATPALTPPTAALRAGNGCVDTDMNATDFVIGPPMPRNTASPANPCRGPAGPRRARQPRGHP
jgi:hypothetical protein